MTQQEEMTRIANAIAIGALGKHFIYCIEENKFYFYDDEVWRDIFEIEIGKLISDHPAFNNVFEHSIYKREQIIKSLKGMVQKRLDQFNTTGRINLDFGEFDPTDHTWHPHAKENYSTIRIDYPNMITADCVLWFKTLDEIFEGDKNKISMLQEFFGYCLTRDTTQRKALLLLGESNCGKSTILQVLRAMVGAKNCSSVALKFLPHPQYTPMLINKLVNIDSDVSAKAQDFEAEFKIITSGEPVSCNQKFIPTFDFVPFCKIVMAANVFPKITDHSSAFYNRLILIPCDRIFPEKEQNKNLYKQLSQELFGIFHWSTAGLKRLQERGMFEQLSFLKEAVIELEDENNPSNIFFKDHVDLNMGHSIEKGDLYDKYVEWGKNNGQYCLPAAKFSQAVYKRFYKQTPKDTKDPITGKRVWRNLKYVDSKEITEGMQLAKEIDFND